MGWTDPFLWITLVSLLTTSVLLSVVDGEAQFYQDCSSRLTRSTVLQHEILQIGPQTSLILDTVLLHESKCPFTLLADNIQLLVSLLLLLSSKSFPRFFRPVCPLQVLCVQGQAFQGLSHYSFARCGWAAVPAREWGCSPFQLQTIILKWWGYLLYSGLCPWHHTVSGLTRSNFCVESRVSLWVAYVK